MAAPNRAEGFADASRALNALSKTVAKNVGRRSLMPSAHLLRDTVSSYAPRLSGNLSDSVIVTDKGTKATARRKRRAGDSSVEVYVIAEDPAAVPQEYGTNDMPAQPYFRRAVDAVKARIFDMVGNDLKRLVIDAAQRAAKRAAKIAAKG